MFLLLNYVVEYFVILSEPDTMYAEISAGGLVEQGRTLETMRNMI